MQQPITSADSIPKWRKPKQLADHAHIGDEELAKIQEKDDSEEPVDNSCLICMERPKDALFIRCGHLVSCMDCACLLKQRNDPCIICRDPIVEVIRTYRV